MREKRQPARAPPLVCSIPSPPTTNSHSGGEFCSLLLPLDKRFKFSCLSRPSGQTRLPGQNRLPGQGGNKKRAASHRSARRPLHGNANRR